VDADFEAAIRRYGDSLAKLAYHLTRDRDLALDLLQDVFEKAFQHWSKVSRAENPQAYLRRMVVNQYLSTARRRYAIASASLERHLAEPGPEGLVADRDALWRALGNLPHRQRAVLVLRYYEDLEDVAIAELLDCRRATVRSLAARGLTTLRNHSPLAPGNEDSHQWRRG
jgi:RNA polymerase sigma-70 factor (sigma-E family)